MDKSQKNIHSMFFVKNWYLVIMFCFPLFGGFFQEISLILLVLILFAVNKMTFSYKNFYLFMPIAFVSLLSELINFGDLKYAIHFFLVLMPFLFNVRGKINIEDGLYCFSFVSVSLNVVTYIVGFINSQFFSIFFIRALDFSRFQSIYNEPSLLAIASVFTHFTLELKVTRISRVFQIINFLILVATGSASGVILMGIVSFVHYVLINKSTKAIFAFLLITILFGLISTEFGFLNNRITLFLNNEIDNSFILRFIAPMDIVQLALNHNPLVGVGFSNLDDFIVKNISILNKQRLFDGTITTSINNGYSILITSVGYFGVLAFIWLFINAVKSNSNRRLGWLIPFIILYPFFSGYIIHVHLWFFIWLLLQRSTDYE